MESTKRISLRLLLRRGLIPLHMLYTTNQPLQIEDGIHSTTIVCVTQKQIGAIRYTGGLVGGGGNANANANDDGREDVMIPAEGLQVVE